MAMGGIYNGIREMTRINPLNPASYVAFDTLSFVFEGGLYSNSVSHKTLTLTQKSNYASLSYLTFGTSFNRWWKSSFGLIPFSRLGYNVATSTVLDDIGHISYAFEGNGGFNEFYWGHAFKISPNVSIGFNASYIFGTLEQTHSILFPDSLYDLNFKTETARSVGDICFTYGIQYFKPVGKSLLLGTGITVNTPARLSATEDYIAFTFTEGSTGIEYPRDTIDNIQNEKGEINMPFRISGGISLEKPGKWLYGLDYQWQNWKNFEAFGKKDSLQNSWAVMAGAEFIPDNTSISKYWEKIHYRFGFRYNHSYLKLKGNQINEFGISFGMGFPFSRTLSTLNVGFEFGARGTTNDGLIQENFFRFTLGVGVFERWFIQRKYD